MPEHSEHSKERDQALMTDIQAFHAVSDSHYMPCKYRTQTLHRCGGQNDLLLQSSGHERKENLFFHRCKSRKYDFEAENSSG